MDAAFLASRPGMQYDAGQEDVGNGSSKTEED
jgi:hypothetical protein